MKMFFKKLLAGFVIGVGAIIPGLSGGILAVSMGLYEPAVDAVANIFKTPKKSIGFLFPLAIGGAVGLVLFMFLLEWLLADFRTAVICVFLGLVAGSVPATIRECNAKGFKRYYPVFAVIGFVAAFGLIVGDLISQGGEVVARTITPLYAMLCGGILMVGVVVPGVSTSFILLNMGLYDNFLALFTSVPDHFMQAWRAGEGFFASIAAAFQDLPLMLCALLGMLIVAVPSVFLIKKLLERFHGPAYYLIFGILVATMVGCAMQEVMRLAADTTYVLTWWRVLVYAALLAGGFLLCLKIEKYMSFKEEQPHGADRPEPDTDV